MADNVITGRSRIGVHWSMDGIYGAFMGEISTFRHWQQVRYTCFTVSIEELLVFHTTLVRKEVPINSI